jgi:hypothetical protein
VQAAFELAANLLQYAPLAQQVACNPTWLTQLLSMRLICNDQGITPQFKLFYSYAPSLSLFTISMSMRLDDYFYLRPFHVFDAVFDAVTLIPGTCWKR